MRNKTKRMRRRYNKKRTYKKRTYKKRGGVQPNEMRQTDLPIQNNNQPLQPPPQPPQRHPQNMADNWRPPRLDPLDLGLNDEDQD